MSDPTPSSTKSSETDNHHIYQTGSRIKPSDWFRPSCDLFPCLVNHLWSIPNWIDGLHTIQKLWNKNLPWSAFPDILHLALLTFSASVSGNFSLSGTKGRISCTLTLFALLSAILPAGPSEREEQAWFPMVSGETNAQFWPLECCCPCCAKSETSQLNCRCFQEQISGNPDEFLCCDTFHIDESLTLAGHTACRLVHCWYTPPMLA